MVYLKLGLLLLMPFAAVLFLPPAETVPQPATGGTPFPENLPGPFTGGFGEETCHSCHFSADLNPVEGAVELEELPERYSPGETYPLTLALRHPELERGGFQLSARYSDGTQAGAFEWDTERLQLTEPKGKIQYLQHTADGIEPEESGTIRWKFDWTAPDTGGTIIFHLSANAANDDQSAFGDRIYTSEVTLKPRTE